MGYDNPDIYYQPEKFGIKPIGEVEWDDESYQFNFTVVWQSLTDPAVFYWATDSGCSCPAPFEDFTGLDYEEVHTGTKAEAIAAILNELARVEKVNAEYSWRTYDPSPDAVELVGKLVQA